MICIYYASVMPAPVAASSESLDDYAYDYTYEAPPAVALPPRRLAPVRQSRASSTFQYNEEGVARFLPGGSATVGRILDILDLYDHATFRLAGTLSTPKLRPNNLWILKRGDTYSWKLLTNKEERSDPIYSGSDPTAVWDSRKIEGGALSGAGELWVLQN